MDNAALVALLNEGADELDDVNLKTAHAIATRLRAAADALAGEARPNVRMSGLVNEEPDTCSLCGPISRRVSPDAHMYRAHGLKRSEWDCIQHPSFDLFEDGEYPYDDTDAARAAQEPTP